MGRLDVCRDMLFAAESAMDDEIVDVDGNNPRESNNNNDDEDSDDER